MSEFPSASLDKFMLRLPDGMRDQIAKDAKANGRSMNAEIIARLAATSGAKVTPAESLNVQQHVWLQLLCAALADGNTSSKNAKLFADEALPLALKRLEELA
ncbi:Arc family DNA-binding protein [Achromobacter sp. ACM01]|uniref:Arc family DNA-binding protein n=1 Tax=Achromobacter sp. ACM01 TaxID=2769298 RepID=UPI0027147779|nr:Arc family DNA-binding protein [Achromobacter sp. ACM01]